MKSICEQIFPIYFHISWLFLFGVRFKRQNSDLCWPRTYAKRILMEPAIQCFLCLCFGHCSTKLRSDFWASTCYCLPRGFARFPEWSDGDALRCVWPLLARNGNAAFCRAEMQNDIVRRGGGGKNPACYDWLWMVLGLQSVALQLCGLSITTQLQLQMSLESGIKIATPKQSARSPTWQPSVSDSRSLCGHQPRNATPTKQLCKSIYVHVHICSMYL